MKFSDRYIRVSKATIYAVYFVVLAAFITASFTGYKFTVYTNMFYEHYIELGFMLITLPYVITDIKKGV